MQIGRKGCSHHNDALNWASHSESWYSERWHRGQMATKGRLLQCNVDVLSQLLHTFLYAWFQLFETAQLLPRKQLNSCPPQNSLIPDPRRLRACFSTTAIQHDDTTGSYKYHRVHREARLGAP